jgi:membrane protease subunit HflC
MGKVQRELKDITSTANREAQEIKGKADAEATRISAEAYSRDPGFYDFYKSLETYKTAIGKNTRLVISADSEFYKHLQEIK